MVDSYSGLSRWVAPALMTLVLLAGSGCSSTDDAPAPTPSGTAASTAPAESTTPAPGPRTTPGRTLPPPPTTPVPQQSPGDVNSTVPTTPEKSRAPVGLDKTSQTEQGVAAKIVEVAAVTAEARGPGEVSGPAVAVTVQVDNRSASAVSLDQVVVNLTASDGSPANPMTAKPAKPFGGRLAAGKKARGVYVFAVAKDDRDPITVDVTISGGGTVLVFRGKA